MRRKRLFSALLALALVLSLLPTTALAHLGGLPYSVLGNSEDVTIERSSVDGCQVYSMTMTDGHMKFSLAVDGEHAGKSVTASVRSGLSFAQSVDNGVYEQARFTIQTGGKTQKKLKIEKMEVLEDPSDAVGPVMPNSLTVRYTFSGYGRLDPQVTCCVSYYFIRLGDGATDGAVSIEAEMPENSRTYAVAAMATWQTADDSASQYVFRYFQDYHGFSRMGHGSLTESAAHVKLSRSYENRTTGEVTAKSTDITAGLGRTTLGKAYGYGSISEIYSDSYGVDSPFVLADYALFDVSHQDVYPPIYMTYNVASDCLIAEGNTGILGGYAGIDSMSAIHAWGLRDVYTVQEAKELGEAKFDTPDEVYIPQDADKLGLYASGSGVLAAPITDSAREQVLKKQYGEPLYILRGNFEKKSDHDGAYYDFIDKSVALTSTITASWSGYGSDQHFYVRVDENNYLLKFDTTAHVQYSTPTFKLYSAKQSDPAAAELGLEGNILTLHMQPEKNNVLVFLDSPEVTCKIDKAQFEADGNLALSGQMGFDLLFNSSTSSLITLEKLGYGPVTKTNADNTTTISFAQNGVIAEGEIGTGALMGLDLAKITAKINTFRDQEVYAFSLELNVFDLFETEAQLELKRLNNGRLVPNDLYFFLAMQPGIPIAPPVPTAYLRGGGGGFFGLADTINGDYIAIPPMRLKFTAAGDYVKVVKGRLHITVGPSYLEYAGTNLELADADILDSFNMYLRLVGEKRSYQNISYTGVRAGGGMGITIKAPEGDRAIFEVESSVEASMFGALDNYQNPQMAYLQLDSRGSILATMKIPKKLGDVEFKIIGGMTLARAGADFILGGQTAFPVASGTTLSEAAKGAWDNLSIYGGLSHTGNFLATHWRVFYVIPKHVGGAFNLVKNINEGWSLDQEIDENNWYFTGGPDTQSLEWSLDEAYAVCDENGDQVGIAVLESSLYELPAETGTEDGGIALLASENGGRVTRNVTIPQSSLGSGALILKLFPEEGGTVEALRNNLTITSGSGTVDLVDPMLIGNVFTNPDTANCTVIEENGRQGLFIATGWRAEAISGITIEADCGFEVECLASADPTTLTLNMGGRTAASTINNARNGKTYAVRYYLDAAQDRSGEHYFLDMVDTGSYSCTVPASGTMAPTGSYFVTAVLVEKVEGDFNGDGTVSPDEFSWVTVDTQTDSTPIQYLNDSTPDAPAQVSLAATGNETLTATWTPVAGASGYRVSLYYQDASGWKLAGASYELDGTDFGSQTQPSATVDAHSGMLSLRMAPTVSGKDENGASDEAPVNTNYMVKVEAYRDDASAEGALSSRYYSAARESDGTTMLPAYEPAAVTVTHRNGQRITLDKSNGYGTLAWSALPADGEALFYVSAAPGVTIEVGPEQGGGTFAVSTADGGVTAEDDAAKALVENSGRVKLTVKNGPDVTEYYLRLTLDDLAPVLTLDSGNIAADPATGAYTLSGITEPGLTVTITDEAGDPVGTATADGTGRFAFQGTLPQDMTTSLDENEGQSSVPSGFKTLFVDVATQDAAGNAASPAAAIISALDSNADDPDTPVTPITPVIPGDGGYTPGNPVSVEETEHGTVTVSPKTAPAGATVTVTVKPDDGYVLEELTVTDGNGKKLPLTARGDGKYTFTMPAGKVTVKADFMDDNSLLNRFYDVPNDAYFYEAVKWAVGKGVTNGVGENRFAPEQPCTRAQIVTFLWRAAGSPVVDYAMDMRDVPEDAYYAEAVCWALSVGVTTGTGADTFSPDAVCTRAQAVTFLWRALGKQAAGKAEFSDVPADGYYADAVAWAAANGVTDGVGSGKFAPEDDCTRAQIVTFLWRAYKK